MIILKHSIPLDDQWHVGPRVETYFHVGHQNDDLNSVKLWAPYNNEIDYYRIVGTGQSFSEGEYIGTTQDSRGFVWHIIRRPFSE